MRVKAIDVLNKIKVLAVGMSATPTLRQSDCLIFQSGKAFTFSGDSFAITSLDLGFEGAVDFKLFQNLLSRYGEQEIDIDKVDAHTLKIACGRSRSKLDFNERVFLSISAISQPTNNWIPIEESFIDAVSKCESVVSPNRMDDVLGSIHIDIGKIEAASTAQIMRVNIQSPFNRRFLVHGGVLGSFFKAAKLTEMQLSGNWLFMRNQEVTYATPVYDDAYLDLDSLLQPVSADVTFPDLANELNICSVLMSKGDLLGIELDSGASLLRLSVNTKSGKHESEVSMTSPVDVKLKIDPGLFRRILGEFGGVCSLASNGVRVITPELSYAASVE